MEKTVQIEISKVVQTEMERMPRWQVMLYLQEQGKTSAYKLAKELSWTTGKVHSILNALEKSNAIKIERKIVNGRLVKFVELKG